jgi:hypothetical protein
MRTNRRQKPFKASINTKYGQIINDRINKTFLRYAVIRLPKTKESLKTTSRLKLVVFLWYREYRKKDKKKIKREKAFFRVSLKWTPLIVRPIRVKQARARSGRKRSAESHLAGKWANQSKIN